MEIRTETDRLFDILWAFRKDALYENPINARIISHLVGFTSSASNKNPKKTIQKWS